MKEDKQLLSIGEASRITGMHVKSLRYYDRIGVFKPDYVDERSGYRYYSFGQLQKIIAVRTCLDTGIVLSELDRYTNDGITDYPGLIHDALGNLDKQIAVLERRKTYLNFLNEEVRFNEKNGAAGKSTEVSGSIALWTMPFEGEAEEFNRKSEFLRMAAAAEKEGYQITPLYFGMLMKCTGDERELYTIAGLENFLHLDDMDDMNKNIYRTPFAHYRMVRRPDLDVTCAESIFPDLFEMEYDKIVLTTISLHSNNNEPMYSMYINLPE